MANNSKKKNKKNTNTKNKVNETNKIKKVEAKEKKNIPVKEVVVKKEKAVKKKKKNNKKLIILISIVVLSLLLVLLIYLNKNCYSRNVSFVSQNNITMSSINDKFTAPVYSFSVDDKDKPVEIENLEFVDEDMKYNFGEVKREVLEDGNVIFTIPCEMEVEIEYIKKDDIDDDWVFTFSYAPVFGFDYYTGNIYHEKTISDKKLIIMDSSKDKKTDKKSSNKKEININDEMVYTELDVHDKKVNIGVLNNVIENNWSSVIYDGKSEDGWHYRVTNNSKVNIYIKVPKDYDGMMLAINKKGSNYESWKSDYENYTKLISLQEDEKKNGKKSDELKRIEKENEVIHKLIDKSDEKRKDYTKDDYYVIRIADLFKDNYLIKEENGINFLYITGIMILIMGILTCMLLYYQEIKK